MCKRIRINKRMCILPQPFPFASTTFHYKIDQHSIPRITHKQSLIAHTHMHCAQRIQKRSVPCSCAHRKAQCLSSQIAVAALVENRWCTSMHSQRPTTSVDWQVLHSWPQSGSNRLHPHYPRYRWQCCYNQNYYNYCFLRFYCLFDSWCWCWCDFVGVSSQYELECKCWYNSVSSAKSLAPLLFPRPYYLCTMCVVIEITFRMFYINHRHDMDHALRWYHAHTKLYSTQHNTEHLQ